MPGVRLCRRTQPARRRDRAFVKFDPDKFFFQWTSYSPSVIRPELMVFYSPTSGRQIKPKYYVQNQRKKYNLTNKKDESNCSITSYYMALFVIKVYRESPLCAISFGGFLLSTVPDESLWGQSGMIFYRPDVLQSPNQHQVKLSLSQNWL